MSPEEPQRNGKFERFCAEDILVHILRSKIVKPLPGGIVKSFRPQ
jgi:hypothetical protein